MNRSLLAVTTLAVAALFTACGEPATGNNANRSATNLNAANTNTAVNLGAVETEIKKLVNDTAGALARNDADALEKLYSDNYMLVNLDGSVQNRTERIGSIRSGDTKFESFVYDEVNVRSNPEGTGAVVIARATAKGMNKGKPVTGLVRVTQVWSKTKDGWRQVSGHATTMDASSAATKADDGKDDESREESKQSEDKESSQNSANRK